MDGFGEECLHSRVIYEYQEPGRGSDFCMKLGVCNDLVYVGSISRDLSNRQMKVSSSIPSVIIVDILTL